MTLKQVFTFGLTFAALLGAIGELAIFPSTAKAGGIQSFESNELSFEEDVKPYLNKYCASCHGAEVQKANFVLHDITQDKSDLQRWEKIAENLELELMPPSKAIQPNDSERFKIVEWIRSHLKQGGISPNIPPYPNQANRIRHEDLFSGNYQGPAFSYSRMWRISQRIYDSVSRDLQATRGPAGRGNGPVPALVEIEGEGFKDYDLLHVDDVALRAMILNFRQLASVIVRGVYRPGRFNAETNTVGPGTYDFRKAALRDLDLLKSDTLAEEAYQEAVVKSFELLLSRKPSIDELQRYQQFLTDAVNQSDRQTGCEQMVKAILMSPEFVFRLELGLGADAGQDRRLLGPNELSYAIAYTLTDSPPDADLRKAVDEGNLKSREDVEREVRRMLANVASRKNWSSDFSWGRSYDWTPVNNPRLLRFFQEFFGYTKGDLVFKDQERNSQHHPRVLIRELDYLILDIVDRDSRVLETLLTTDKFIVGFSPPEQVERELRSRELNAYEKPAGFVPGAMREGLIPGTLPGHRYPLASMVAYGIEYHHWSHPVEQPFEVENRVGVLTHPAWLVAWSGNFDNDIIRRGKWIREHLLADALPDLPIGVDAKIPDDPHQTLRERMAVTRAEECWRCHKQMDPLGMAFEEYDDFGRFRNGRIVLGDELVHAKNLHRYREDRKRKLQELWKLTAQSDEARMKRVEFLTRRIADMEPPSNDHERFEQIVQEQQRNRSNWEKEIEALKQGPENVDWQKQAASIRMQLSEMHSPKPAEFAPVRAEGILTGTRDSQLDGAYNGVADLMHRLAKSNRVRQSFIRHVFRYFMGRNEMLSDSSTLMAMDEAYVNSDGSFKEVIVTLMTSDSFLTRKDRE